MQQRISDQSYPYYPHHQFTNPPLPNTNPNPSSNPNDYPHNFASAPPYQPYPSYPHNPDPTSYAPPQPQISQEVPPFQPYAPPPPFAGAQQSSNTAPNLYPSYEGYGGGGSGGYFDQNSARYEVGDAGSYGRGGSGYQPDVFTEGVYAYDGGRSEPYGARGTASTKSPSSWSGFDDYGRAKGSSSSQNEQESVVGKIVRAVPKEDVELDAKNWVQKFRVKLLAETPGQTTMDVLCQIGLDGIRMLDTSTNRTLRIYPLDTVMKCEMIGSSIFAFWSKTSVDFEPRRIRLESNSYMANTILDTVTAAKFQFNEMGGKDGMERSKGPSDSSKQSEQMPDMKKGLVDWMNRIKPVIEEKDHWVPDEVISKCTSCGIDFGAFVRKHHCRNCGEIFCDKCTSGRTALTADENAPVVRVCDRCLAEVTERLSRAKESVSKSAGLYSHEDLARKLQVEMEKNRKSSAVSGSSDGSGMRLREVACPICTVHLQVEVPSSGSKTIECGVCQQPFLVSAH